MSSWALGAYIPGQEPTSLLGLLFMSNAGLDPPDSFASRTVKRNDGMGKCEVCRDNGEVW